MTQKVNLYKIVAEGGADVPLEDLLDSTLMALNVRVAGSSAPVAGTVTAPATAGTAIILGTQACQQLWVSAPASNTVNVLLGTSTTTLPIPMVAGATPYVFPVSNVNKLYCKSSTSSDVQVLNWMACP